MADSMLQKDRTFFVPAIGHKPSAICSGLTLYAIGSSFSGRGGRLAELTRYALARKQPALIPRIPYAVFSLFP
jgi:hypothetical protein